MHNDKILHIKVKSKYSNGGECFSVHYLYDDRYIFRFFFFFFWFFQLENIFGQTARINGKKKLLNPTWKFALIQQLKYLFTCNWKVKKKKKMSRRYKDFFHYHILFHHFLWHFVFFLFCYVKSLNANGNIYYVEWNFSRQTCSVSI